MISRRALLGSVGVACAAPRLAPAFVDPAFFARDGAADDEEFWGEIGQAFTVDRTIVNLNNGGVSPSPRIVQDAMKRHLDYSNAVPPPLSLWIDLEPRREPLRERIARHWGVDGEEIAFTRNASESLHTCQLGLDFEPGDELLTTDQDYPRMREAFRQRAERERLRVVTISLPVPCEDDDEVVRRFEAAVSERTRMILVCHVVNITGQILPVARIAELGRKRGITVIVDGAHAFANFPFRLRDIGCDAYGTSLHKWLFAPHGNGLLYMPRDRVAKFWPLMPSEVSPTDIRKFEEIGTHPAANTLAVAEALTFHQMIGDERKAARLRHLRDRCMRPLIESGGAFRLHTSLDPRFACGMATIELVGVDQELLAKWLLEKHGILVAAIVHPQFTGVRVSPSIYSTMEEIDRFVGAMLDAERNGFELEVEDA